MIRLWVWVCDLVMILVVGGDSGTRCSCGGANGWFYFYFCFRWWWPTVASRRCGFVKNVVGFRERERQKDKKYNVL